MKDKDDLLFFLVWGWVFIASTLLCFVQDNDIIWACLLFSLILAVGLILWHIRRPKR